MKLRCPNPNIMSEFKYNRLQGIAEAKLFSMFKFPQSNRVHFQCDIVLCKGSIKIHILQSSLASFNLMFPFFSKDGVRKPIATRLSLMGHHNRLAWISKRAKMGPSSFRIQCLCQSPVTLLVNTFLHSCTFVWMILFDWFFRRGIHLPGLYSKQQPRLLSLLGIRDTFSGIFSHKNVYLWFILRPLTWRIGAETCITYEMAPNLFSGNGGRQCLPLLCHDWQGWKPLVFS